MKKRYIFFILFTVVFPAGCILAQNLGPAPGPVLDSLNRALLLAKSDTAKLSLRCSIGAESQVCRPPYWDSIIKDARQYHSVFYEAKGNEGLGYCLKQLGRMDEALAAFDRSLKLYEANKNKEELFLLCHSLSSTYFTRNELKQSLEYCYKSLRLAEELNDKRKVTDVYSLLGLIYFRSGEPEKAIEVSSRCLEICLQNGFKEETVCAMLALGGDYQQLSDTPNTIKYYMKAKQYINEFDNGMLSASINNSVGAAYEMLAESDSARRYFQAALNIAQKTRRETVIASSLVLLAQNSFNRGDNKAAKKQALQAFELVKKTHFKGQIPTLAILLKDIYAKDKDYEQALRFYELSVTTRDSVTSEKNKRETLQKKYEYDLEKKENANKLLAQKNEIQSLQISKDRYVLSGLIVLLLLLLVIAALFLRQSKIKAERQRMRVEQKLLRAQMTPHFIFNALQAIQHFILRQEEKKAVKYLGSFASLIRNVLENSRKEHIPLAQEISMLTKYLELQQLRFLNRFEYQIIVGTEIKPELTQIPPMLSQPFVENAIEHGMQALQSGGLVTITYALRDGLLYMYVVDNGQGMKAASGKGKEHQSLAIEITRERIELMNRRERKKVTFDISEAFPLREQGKGVKVSFSLPINLYDE